MLVIPIVFGIVVSDKQRVDKNSIDAYSNNAIFVKV